MRAAVFEQPGRIIPKDVPDPVASPGDLLVDLVACGVCGSDLDSWRTGAHARTGQILGHELVGTVHKPEPVTGLEAGEAVIVRPLIPCRHCHYCHRGQWQLCPHALEGGIGYGLSGGFADQLVIPQPVLGLTVFRWPPSLPLEHGALVEPVAVALHGLRRARLGVHETVVVSGLGPIGLAVVALARTHQAAHIIGVDPSLRRREAAVELGADTVVDPTADVTAAVREVTGPGSFGLGAAADLVVECSGSPAAFKEALKSVAPGGRICLIAHSHDRFAFKSGRLIEKEVDVIGSFGYQNEFPDVIELLRSGRLNIEGFISHRFPISSIVDALTTQADPARSLKVVIHPDAAFPAP